MSKRDKTKPRQHIRDGRRIPCGFCGGTFRSYRLRFKHAQECAFPEGKRRALNITG